VDIFIRPDGGTARVVPQNEDECILCQACVDRCPVDAVSVLKLY
jgi:NAD-dependent dihydropyrimidine dehydrogenase PreA subunit